MHILNVYILNIYMNQHLCACLPVECGIPMHTPLQFECRGVGVLTYRRPCQRHSTCVWGGEWVRQFRYKLIVPRECVREKGEYILSYTVSYIKVSKIPLSYVSLLCVALNFNILLTCFTSPSNPDLPADSLAGLLGGALPLCALCVAEWEEGGGGLSLGGWCVLGGGRCVFRNSLKKFLLKAR